MQSQQHKYNDDVVNELASFGRHERSFLNVEDQRDIAVFSIISNLSTLILFFSRKALLQQSYRGHNLILQDMGKDDDNNR